MKIILINDSKDDNARVRQEVRYANLFPQAKISFIGIDSSLGVISTIEASGNLIDSLDALGENEGLVCVNVAPRGQIEEDGYNGSNFCYFWYKNVLVVSTVKAYNLSLIKKLNLVDEVKVMEMDEVLEFAHKENLIDKDLKNYISTTQFRSYDFQPRIAKWLIDDFEIPHSPLSIKELPDSPSVVWLIDSFGNAKTTLLFEDIVKGNPADSKRINPSFIAGSLKILNRVQNDKITITTNLGKFNYYERLKDVPDGETAFYTGSSGIGDKRFVEIATQNRKGSAANKLNLKIGDRIELK